MLQNTVTIDQAAEHYIKTNRVDQRTETALQDLMLCRTSAVEGRSTTPIGSIRINEAEKWQLKQALSSFAKSRWEDREEAIMVAHDFFGSIGIDAKINLNDSYESRVEPFVRIMKHIQEGGHTQEEIAEYFSTSTTTIEKYMAPLQTGVDLLGKHIQVKELERGSNKYNPSIHPVFLTLNLTEVNALTVVLKQLFGANGPMADHPCRQQFLDIANDVHSQLSNYAADIIDANAERARVAFEQCPDYRQEEMQIAYFLKSGEKCVVECAGFGNPLVGTFSLANYEPGCIAFVTESGKQHLLPYSGISSVDKSN